MLSRVRAEGIVSAMRPLIGIPPCLDDQGRWRPTREYHYADAAYARAVEQAGGVPVYLPQQGDVAALLDRLDGLLVPGGGDFAPDRRYPASVSFDLVLGICYGMQLLALHCGGSLHFDLPTDVPGASEHRFADPGARHAIRLESASRLRGALGADHAAVNSRHHQAVADAGNARVSARSEDGIVEAIELPDARFAVGVQWHPESLGEDHRAQVFGAFVRTCGSRG
jgi:putative glutamine amidotransferase